MRLEVIGESAGISMEARKRFAASTRRALGPIESATKSVEIRIRSTPGDEFGGMWCAHLFAEGVSGFTIQLSDTDGDLDRLRERLAASAARMIAAAVSASPVVQRPIHPKGRSGTHALSTM